MSTRKFVALGTASQVPTRYRNHNGYFLKWDEEGILFDPGEGTQRQMIMAGVSATEITKICITHFHGDHCLGLAGIVQRLSLDRVPHEVEIHYPASGQKYFERLREASIFHNVARLKPKPITAPGVISQHKDFSISTARLEHTAESWGFRLQEADSVTMLPEKLEEYGLRGPVVGQLKREGRVTVGGREITVEQVSVHKRGQSVAFVMDTRLCAAARELAQGADLFVCESTYLHSERGEARQNGHMTARQAAEIARDTGVRKLLLTHFSQRYPDTREFLAEAQAIFPHVQAVRDGDEVSIMREQMPGLL
jgi:ribonuclease Z